MGKREGDKGREDDGAMRGLDDLKTLAQLGLRELQSRGWLLISVLLLVGWGDLREPMEAIAQSSDSAQELETAPSETAEPTPYLRPRTTCPQDVETLTIGLLRDLPGYANRVASRSLGVNDDIGGFGTVLVAGQAEFEPLDIAPRTFREPEEGSQDPIQQVFFTTLERQYSGTEVLNLEHYHWLFLTEAEDGWRLALMFSRVAVDAGAMRPPTPPRESSEGITGQAVRLWLRDCRAGAVYPVDAPTADDSTVDDSIVDDFTIDDPAVVDDVVIDDLDNDL